MTPKQWIRYVKKLEKNNKPICDGITEEPMGIMNLLYPFIILTGFWVIWRVALKIVSYKRGDANDK